jgi:hypothetical protein
MTGLCFFNLEMRKLRKKHPTKTARQVFELTKAHMLKVIRSKYGRSLMKQWLAGLTLAK